MKRILVLSDSHSYFDKALKIFEKEKPEVHKPVAGTPSPANPPGFDNHNNIVDDIPELPPLPEESHHTVPTVPTNDDNTGDIPELPPLPGDTNDTTGGDIPELPPLPPTDGSTETTPHENEPGSASPAEPPAPPSEDETVPELPKEPDAGTVVKPPTVGDDDIPPLPPAEDLPSTGEPGTTPTESKPKIPTTMPDGSPIPENAVVDPNTGIITVESEDYITEVVTIYRDAIDLYYEDKEAYEDEKQDFYNDIEKIKPKYREVDLGFFYKKTMY